MNGIFYDEEKQKKLEAAIRKDYIRRTIMTQSGHQRWMFENIFGMAKK